MAIKATRIGAKVWYTPECEEGESSPTRFHLKPLTEEEKENCISLTASGEATIDPSKNKHVLSGGLVGWENFNDDDGKEIKHSKVSHSRIPLEIRMELVGKIYEISYASEEDEKNSQSQLK
jgi:hypothetical protein